MIDDSTEPLFIYRHKVQILPAQIHKVLKNAIVCLGIDASLYDFHSLRAGRTTELIKLGFSIEQVKRMGRWKSNAVYRYIKE